MLCPTCRQHYDTVTSLPEHLAVYEVGDSTEIHLCEETPPLPCAAQGTAQPGIGFLRAVVCQWKCSCSWCGCPDDTGESSVRETRRQRHPLPLLRSCCVSSAVKIDHSNKSSLSQRFEYEATVATHYLSGAEGSIRMTISSGSSVPSE